MQGTYVRPLQMERLENYQVHTFKFVDHTQVTVNFEIIFLKKYFLLVYYLISRII